MNHRPRVYVAEPLQAGAELTLDKAPSHHLADVLRLKAGGELDVFNGDGLVYQAQLLEAGKRCRLALLSSHSTNTESSLHICLWQGLSRGERMDASVRQAVELGAHSIRPVVTQRSQVRLDEKRAAKRHQHWTSIIVSAAEQSGRAVIPRLHPLASLEHSLQARNADSLGLVLAPGAPTSIGRFVPESRPQTADLLIGPESGFAETELEAAQAAGFMPLSAGHRILRTETAGPAAIAILQARFGDLT